MPPSDTDPSARRSTSEAFASPSTIGPRTIDAPREKLPRDIRLDFFRGLALWFIFVDHTPSNAIANLTYRNFGFSDATEIFVFISGYTAALVYGLDQERRGFLYMTAQVLRRCWQLYVAHIVLFLFFVTQIYWASQHFDNPVYIEELNIGQFLDDPGQTLLRALILDYRPVNLDILPLYMALLLGLPVVLAGLRRAPALTFGLSGLLYAGVQHWKWTLPVYESGTTWMFNPLGWQFLFVIGALCGHLARKGIRIPWRPGLGTLAGLYLAFSLAVAMSWKIPALDAIVSPRVEKLLYPIDKTNLDVLRLAHFLAVAYLVSHFVPRGSPLLRWPICAPLIACGRHSLYIFCLGISLSFVAYFVLVQSGGSLITQLLVIMAGSALMYGLALLLDWYRHRGVHPARGGAGG